MTQNNTSAGFCMDCGNPFFIGQKFCRGCGIRFDSDAYSIPSIPQIQSTNRPHNLLYIELDNQLKGKTVVITSMANESEVFYAPVTSDAPSEPSFFGDINIYGHIRATASIWIPIGNYIVTIMGENGKRYVTVTEGTGIRLQW